jgi:Xaa-Pro aminopeptidase
MPPFDANEKMNTEIYRVRRNRVLEAMAARGGGVAIQPTAPERLRNRDSEYPFRFDSHFYYLSGFTEPESVLALVAHGDVRRSVLFCRDRDAEREIWDGHRYGPDAARDLFGFDAAFSIAKLDEEMPKLIADSPALFYPLGTDANLDGQVQRWLGAVRAAARTGKRAPAQAVDLHSIVDEMRLVKDEVEIATMRRAGSISAAAHVRAMKTCRPGMREYHLEAELLHEFRSRGAQAPAYNAIVAAGANACVLHYRAGDVELRAGDLCLIDAGCELDGYASDVTRTFPVDGRFSGPQREIYDLVLAAQHAAFAQVRPGNGFDAPHDAAVRVLAQGLIDLGLVGGSLDVVLESGSYRQFYMHRTGHWLGLDVHDVGDYRAPDGIETNGTDRPWRSLAEGMVLTVEPGLYLRPADNVPAQFHNIGVRIEDDVLVTANGHAVLTADAPTGASDIEALMRS